MKHIVNIINEIRNTSSTKKKQEIIKSYHKEFHKTFDDSFRKVLIYTLDPFITFGIKKIPNYINDEVLYKFDKVYVVLDLLKTRSVTGNTAIDMLQHLLTHLSKDDAKLLEHIIEKDFKAGFSGVTVNKALGLDVIPVYHISKCGGWNEKTKSKINYPAIAQTKMDSIRCNAFVTYDKIYFKTSSGKELDLKDNAILEELSKFPKNIVLDGELLISDGNDSYLSRKESAGILLKLQHGTISKEEEELVRYVVWEYIELEKFYEGKSNIKYSDNFSELAFLLYSEKSTKVKAVESVIVNNEKELLEFYSMQLSLQREGCIVKNYNHVWRDGRDNDTLKLKPLKENTMDLIITDVIEGSNKYKNMLGAFQCTNKDETLVVNVGTGFSDKQRLEYFDKSYIGKVIEVYYNEIISKKNSNIKSLFLPGFKMIRDDKSPEDIT